MGRAQLEQREPVGGGEERQRDVVRGLPDEDRARDQKEHRERSEHARHRARVERERVDAGHGGHHRGIPCRQRVHDEGDAEKYPGAKMLPGDDVRERKERERLRDHTREKAVLDGRRAGELRFGEHGDEHREQLGRHRPAKPARQRSDRDEGRPERDHVADEE